MINDKWLFDSPTKVGLIIRTLWSKNFGLGLPIPNGLILLIESINSSLMPSIEIIWSIIKQLSYLFFLIFFLQNFQKNSPIIIIYFYL